MSNLSDKPWLVPGHMYQYDIGWLVDKILSFETELNTAIDLKTIHYADPIQWDITTQYAPNTVVVDPKTGTAYMSKTAVPAGILLSNTDYWVVIFNYQRIYDKIMSGVAFNDRDSLNASKDLLVNDLVWYGGDLYRCTRAIPEGTTYIPGTNLTPTTIADCLATYYGRDRVAQVLNDTVNVSGDYTLNAGDIAETASNVTIHSTKDMVLDADGSLTEQVTGGKTSEVGGKLTERVTGSRELDVDGDDSVHVDGVTSVNRGGAVTEVYGSSVDKRVTGAFTESFEDTVSSVYKGKKIVNGKDIIINSDTIKLIPTTPLIYSKPQKINNSISGVPFTDIDNNQYYLIAGDASTTLNDLLKPSGDITGLTDAVNIQTALDNDGTVLLDNGVFYINKPLELKMYDIIKGNGNTNINMTTDSQFAIQKSNASLNHIQIKDIKITAHSTSTKYALDFLVPYPADTYLGFRYCVMQNVWIHNFYGGINASAFWSTLFINCRFVVTNTGMRLGNAVNNINVIACQFSRSPLVESGGAAVVMDSRNGVENYNIIFIGCDCEMFDIGYKMTTTIAPCWLNCYWEKVKLPLQLDSTPQAVINGGNSNQCELLARIDNSYSSAIYKGLVSIKNVFMRVNSNNDLYAVIPTSNVGKVYCENINIVNDGSGKTYYLSGEKDKYRTQQAYAKKAQQTMDIKTKFFKFYTVGSTDKIKVQPFNVRFNTTTTLSASVTISIIHNSTTIQTITIPTGTYNIDDVKNFNQQSVIITDDNNFKIETDNTTADITIVANAYIGEFDSPTTDANPLLQA